MKHIVYVQQNTKPWLRLPGQNLAFRGCFYLSFCNNRREDWSSIFWKMPLDSVGTPEWQRRGKCSFLAEQSLEWGLFGKMLHLSKLGQFFYGDWEEFSIFFVHSWGRVWHSYWWIILEIEAIFDMPRTLFSAFFKKKAQDKFKRLIALNATKKWIKTTHEQVSRKIVHTLTLISI